ncbi:hypothetical protein DSECCO2_522960 [anaerobic digester metagenome]
MVVLPCRIEDKLGFEVLEDGHHQRIKNVEYALIRSPRRKRNIYCPAQGFRASQFVRKTGSWIECPPVLVERNKKYVRVIVKNLLCPVPVMDVGVHNCDPADPVFFSQVLYKDCFIIDIAKTAVSVSNCHGVVARRADEGESVFNFSSHEGIGKYKTAASRNQMWSCSLSFYVRDTEMDPCNVLKLRKARLVLCYLREIHQPFFKNLVPGIEETFLPFRVGWGNCPVKSGEENKTCFFTFCPVHWNQMFLFGCIF